MGPQYMSSRCILDVYMLHSYVSRLSMCVRAVVNRSYGNRTVFCALIKAPLKASLTVVYELVFFTNVSRHYYERFLTLSNPP